jgi:hypothetical protein
MTAMRLPKSMDGDPRLPAVEAWLASATEPLWPGGTILVPTARLDDALVAVLSRAVDDGRATRGLEAAAKRLDSEARGLDHADRGAGTQRGARISRLLLVASDGAERFYRHTESLLARHADRVLAVRLDADAATLGARVFGADAVAKLVLFDHKMAVAAALFAIAAQPGGDPPAHRAS